MYFSKIIKIVFFALFNFDKNSLLSLEELTFIFISSCKGLSKLLRINVPDSKTLRDVASVLFFRYDTNRSQSIDFNEYFGYI